MLVKHFLNLNWKKKKKENLQQSVCRQTEDEVERRKATVEVSITEKVQDVLRWYELCFR